MCRPGQPLDLEIHAPRRKSNHLEQQIGVFSTSAQAAQRMIAWRIQEKLFGGHDKATLKLLNHPGWSAGKGPLKLPRAMHRFVSTTPSRPPR
jgi:hypothetical protein